mgnify:CR=1 FL=1
MTFSVQIFLNYRAIREPQTICIYPKLPALDFTGCILASGGRVDELGMVCGVSGVLDGKDGFTGCPMLLLGVWRRLDGGNACASR